MENRHRPAVRRGFSREEGGVGLAHVTGSHDKPFLAVCEFFAGDSVDCEERLQEEVKRRELVRSRGIGVIGFGSYGLFQVAPPAVPDAELRDAVRWQVKDLIDYPLEEAVVDVFRVGSDNRREGAKNAYVVTARQSVVQRQARLMRQARLKIDAIDIPELSLRNLAARLPEDARGVSLLYLGDAQGVIIVCRGGRLQLAREHPFRHLRLIWRKKPARESVGFNEPQERLSLLALDIQRSPRFLRKQLSPDSCRCVISAPLSKTPSRAFTRIAGTSRYFGQILCPGRYHCRRATGS